MKKINKQTFIVPAVLLLIIMAIGAIFPDKLGVMMKRLLYLITRNFTWFYMLGTTALVVIVLWVCFSKYGNIRFGGKDAKPEMSTFKWFCIVLTSGMAAGICYYAIAEPLDYFENPPVFSGAEGSSAQAAEQALQYVFFHWTLHPYAIYVVVALAIGLMYWNAKKPFSVASGLYPLFGKRVLGPFSNGIDALAIFALVCGVGTSMGLSVDQITVGINYLTGKNFDPDIVGIFICLGFAIAAIVAASSGLHKGIGYISTANVYMFIFLLVFVFVFGGTRFILNNTVSSVGKYLSFLVGQTFYTEAAYQSGWVGTWTVFYWAWWTVFAPLIGLFQVKMAKGRTIREFVIVNMFAPSVFLMLWFGGFGSSVIHMGLTGNDAVSTAYAEYGSSVALFAYLKELPCSWLLIVVAFLAIIFSILTLTEAEVMTIADLCVKTELQKKAESDIKSPLFLKIFWGLAMSLMAFVLLYAGGLEAVQTLSIVLGLPILVLLLLLGISLVKGVRNYHEEEEETGSAAENAKAETGEEEETADSLVIF